MEAIVTEPVALRSSRRPSLPIRDALAELLDVLEEAEEDLPRAPGSRFALVSTGVPALDHVLDGGLRLGAVTLIDAEDDVHGLAACLWIARSTPAVAQIDHPNPLALTSWLIASEARVPHALLRSRLMSEHQWDRVARAVNRLATLDLLQTSASDIGDLRWAAHRNETDVLLVLESDRLAPAGIRGLVDLAQALDVAVVTVGWPTSAEPVCDALDVQHVLLTRHGHDRATLTCASATDLLRVASIQVDALTGSCSMR